ncbi:MAG TPA: hypothetical protein ENH57_02120 [Actinobacteria bacterium]|nr:hypothetical protein [Actinomycetota bacterium]
MEVGYSKAYVYNGEYSKLWDRQDVKAELDRQEVALREKAGRSVAQIDWMYQKAYDLAMDINQPSAAGSNTTGIARLYGMDKDAGGGEQTVIVISPPQPAQGPIGQDAALTSRDPSFALNEAAAGFEQKPVESEIINEV